MDPRSPLKKNLPAAFLALMAWTAVSPALAGSLSFSKPSLQAVLPWTSDHSPGAPQEGADWLVVDGRGRFLLVSGLDFDLFSRDGKWIRTTQPLDAQENFYGFAGLEALAKGGTVVLVRLESVREQWGKDNFELRTKPGVRRVLLDTEGKVREAKEFVDDLQPHSSYWLMDGAVYAVHDDGTYRELDPEGPAPSAKEPFLFFARTAFEPERWLAHLKGLPVFRSKNGAYHDIHGQVHDVPGASSFLLGRRFVEGVGPLAFRRGRTYYRVVCDEKKGFVDSVFVEDPARKSYALVELERPEGDLTGAKRPVIHVDGHGDIFEGVAKKDGYRIYRWRALN
ncbi:MAG TPA: hypothetical protein VHE12_00460 [bacterium]|nr:hypothetical protein [bacterium]